jgi:hypothetical protein
MPFVRAVPMLEPWQVTVGAVADGTPYKWQSIIPINQFLRSGASIVAKKKRKKSNIGSKNIPCYLMTASTTLN